MNERCESANATSTGDDDDDDEIFDSLTLIEPSVILDVGLIAEAGVGLAGGKPIEFNAEYGLLNKTFELPTACLRFDAESGGYAPAVTAAAAAGEGVGSGGVRLGMVGLKVLAGLLVAVFVVVV